ncbi:unnamed protein product [Callosobruchus maculatus]|uniref:BHLH domain-containing protein n=2 Tax=Callosobruchus maculatus TaxID=64391 RepID=A0A653D780_CALMS|nr:unnamed protein product [Callosobruchus maculatus]
MDMMVDEDYMGLMSDTLFSSIANQPFVFPDPREIAKAGLADFIQPSLGPLQPNLDDYMDTFDPIQDFVGHRLPTVPEENQSNQPSLEWGYIDSSLANSNLEVPSLNSTELPQYPLSQIQQVPLEKQVPIQDTRQQQILTQPSFGSHLMLANYVTEGPPPPYPSVISKNSTTKALKSSSKEKVVPYSKSMDSIFGNYPQTQNVNTDRLQSPSYSQAQQEPTQQEQIAAELQRHQQQIQQTLEQYKLVQAASQDAAKQHGYKFPLPTAPQIKFSQQQPQQSQQQPQQVQNRHQMHMAGYARTGYGGNSVLHGVPKEELSEPKRRGATRGRGRSRSNTREGVKRPPLLSAASDSSLLTPQTSVLLTQLLTNSSDSSGTFYNQTRSLSQPSQKINSTPVLIKEESSVSMSQSGSSHSMSQLSVSPDHSSSDPLLLNTFSDSDSPVMDPLAQSIHSPTSSHSSIGSPTTESCHRDRRSGHIHAEQKRRYNIKNGFDMIHSLIPHLQQNPNAKLSKAAMLQKGAEYIRQLKAERNQLKEEMESLRHQIDALNTSISNCQSLLPATGAPVSRRTDCKMQEMFDEYVRSRTMENWKFWIFSLIFRPLLSSFNNFVSSSSLDDLYSSTMHWIEQHCTLADLRPVVLNSLRYLCTKTEILSDPEKLPDEAREIVLESKTNKKH